MSTEMDYYIGFDVGTGSGRACMVDRTGKLIAEHSEAIKTQRSPTDHTIFEQSTTDIWSSLSKSCQTVLSSSGVPPASVKGIGFDATCSLAVVDRSGKPVSISRRGVDENDERDENIGKDGEWNIVLWSDHRAIEEATAITATKEGVLGFVGMTESVEMDIPKILWLSKHMTKSKFKDCMFFDLADYLTYRATSSLARSNCCIACKFSYVPIGATMVHECDGGKEEVSKQGWSTRFFQKIGLGAVAEDKYEQFGGIPGENGLVLSAGQPVGKGLSRQAANELGLEEGTAVGSGVIDAYAGWAGTVAAIASTEGGKTEDKPTLEDAGRRLAAVAGTSTCHVVQSKEGILVPGVWGPYRDNVFPGLWMNEGGQSCTGQLIDFMMATHPAYPRLSEMAKKTGKNAFDILGEKLEEMQREQGAETLTHLTKDLHFYPDLHGNRSPLADNQMKGMMTGLTLDEGLNDLASKFNVTLEAIALQTRHIVEAMNAKGHKIDSIYLSGSQAKNGPLMRLLATVLQMPIIIPSKPSAAVVLGSAMLGRFAHHVSTSRQGRPIVTQADADEAKSESGKMWDIMVEMTHPAMRIEPRIGEGGKREKKLLDTKYAIFRESVEVQNKWRDMVAEAVRV